MTSDVKLLPLPASSYQLNHDDATGTEIAPPTPFWNADKMHAYARANVAHATAARDAEIEALRAEVERLTRANGALTQLWESAGAEQNKAEARAERLAEELRECRPFVAYAYDRGIVGAELAGRNLDAALDQENSDG